jgi:hypothetical protein
MVSGFCRLHCSASVQSNGTMNLLGSNQSCFSFLLSFHRTFSFLGEKVPSILEKAIAAET